MTGVSRSRGPRRVNGAEREHLTAECARRYYDGQSLQRISADIGRSFGFVRYLLLEAGVRLRARGGDHRSALTKEATKLGQNTASSACDSL